MCHCSAILPAIIILLKISYAQCIGFTPAAIDRSVAHTYSITDIVSVYECVPDQYPVIVRRYPEHCIVMISIQRITEVIGAAPFARTISFRIPDIL